MTKLTYDQNRIKVFEQAGMCQKCGKKPPEPMKKRCQKCLCLQRAASKKRREKLVSMELCINCGRSPVPYIGASWRPMCDECILKSRASNTLKDKDKWVILKELWEEQDGKCNYSGFDLNIDVAQIDHIKAASSGGSNEKENLQWLCHHINQMKGSINEESFLLTIKVIYENLRLDLLSNKNGGRFHENAPVISERSLTILNNLNKVTDKR